MYDESEREARKKREKKKLVHHFLFITQASRRHEFFTMECVEYIFFTCIHVFPLTWREEKTAQFETKDKWRHKSDCEVQVPVTRGSFSLQMTFFSPSWWMVHIPSFHSLTFSLSKSFVCFSFIFSWCTWTSITCSFYFHSTATEAALSLSPSTATFTSHHEFTELTLQLLNCFSNESSSLSKYVTSFNYFLTWENRRMTNWLCEWLFGCKFIFFLHSVFHQIQKQAKWKKYILHLQHPSLPAREESLFAACNMNHTLFLAPAASSSFFLLLLFFLFFLSSQYRFLEEREANLQDLQLTWILNLNSLPFLTFFLLSFQLM